MFSQKQIEYVVLEDKEGPGSGLPPYQAPKRPASHGWLALILLLCLPVTAIITFFGTRHASSYPAICQVVNDQCTHPPIRREWRTLSKAEKSYYIEAVQCMATQPSMINGTGTISDDFARTHQSAVTKGHQSGPFFPYHRLFIHLYEKQLQEHCGYQGVLPYWDWSQDVHNFRNSPIWNTEHGFGGDGAADSVVTVGNGRCVSDGPLAELTAKYYGEEDKPHCISRGFVDEEELDDLAELVSPDTVEALMEEPSFDKFALALEHRAHKWITHTIRGEFSSYTGPNDPVFFLHHGNLDRLWVQWQQKHSFTAYGGKHNMVDSSPASVNDVLDVGELYPSITVAELMLSTSGMFCYQY